MRGVDFVFPLSQEQEEQEEQGEQEEQEEQEELLTKIYQKAKIEMSSEISGGTFE